MNRDHAAELIPAFVVDALEPEDRLLVEGLLSIDPGAAARRERLEALLDLQPAPPAADPDAHARDWAAICDRLPASRPAAAPPAGVPGYEGLPNVLEGRYLITEELGRGATGAVFRALDQETGATVAVRLYLGGPAVPRWRERARRELAALDGLEHPNLVLPTRVGMVGEHIYTVLPFVPDARSLQERLTPGRPWSPGRAARTVRQAGLGLAAAHRRGVVHGDLTPHQLLIDADERVRVTQVGERALRPDDSYALTRCGVAIGTPFYLPPELVQGKPGFDERADVYALGQILYELLTGQLAFRGRTSLEVFQAKLEGRLRDPRDVLPELAPGYREVLGKALATDPQHRYPCVEAFLAELEAVERGEAITPALAPPWGRGGLGPGLETRWPIVVAALAAAVAAVLGLLWALSAAH